MTAGRWRAIAVVLAVVLVASLVGLGSSLRSRADDPVAADRALALRGAERGAEKAARAAAVHLTTYDWRTLDTDFAWAETDGTKRFQALYAEASEPVRKFVLEVRATAEGSVVASAATARDRTHVEVLLFVDQTLTTVGSKQRKLDQPRLTLDMVRTGGRWLVDVVTLSNLTDS